MAKIIEVAAAILCLEQKILLTSRPVSKSHPGYWEFPGGKIEAGETAVTALCRELKEELGIVVAAQDCKFFTVLEQSYANDTVVKLQVFMIDNWMDRLQALEGQELYWQLATSNCDKESLLPTTVKLLTLLKQYFNG